MRNVETAVDDVRLRNPGRLTPVQPPVVVMNLFHSGLGIVRQLSGRGIRIVGLSAHPRAYGNSTRLCEVWRAPHSQEQPEQLADFLIQSGPRLEGAVVFPTGDADLLFLDRFRERLEAFYRLALPARQVLYQIVDKGAQLRVAVTAGVPVPRSMVVHDDSELEDGAESVGFPCVGKPVCSVHWRRGNNWNLVGRRKAFCVNDLTGLR